MAKKTINNLVVVGDTHIGDQLALCPDVVRRRHGGTYRPSRFQKYIKSKWEQFWYEWVPKVTRGDEYALLFNGDMVEGRHHGAFHPITLDNSEQLDMAEEVLAPVVETAKGGLYYVSGTPAHAGEAGENEEILAKRLGAIQDEHGNYSRFELFIRVGKALCHASHHIGTTGSMAYETTALTKEFNEFNAESARWRRPFADILIRSHRHRHSEVRIPTANGYGTIFVTSAWQLKTPWLFRTPGGRVATPMIGGSLIRQGDEEFFTRHMTGETDRPKTETPRIEG